MFSTVFVKATAGGLINDPGIVFAGTSADLLVKSSLLFVGPTASGALRGPFKSELAAVVIVYELASPPG